MRNLSPYTFYWIDGEKEILHGANMVDALERAEVPIERAHGLQYWCPGEDDSFALVYDTKRDVHVWQIKNAQQIYKQLSDQATELINAGEMIGKYRTYMISFVSMVKQFMESNDPTAKETVMQSINNFFEGMKNMKEVPSGNKKIVPPTKEEYDEIKKRYDLV